MSGPSLSSVVFVEYEPSVQRVRSGSQLRPDHAQPPEKLAVRTWKTAPESVIVINRGHLHGGSILQQHKLKAELRRPPCQLVPLVGLTRLDRPHLVWRIARRVSLFLGPFAR